jgi:hypothetical protein
MQTENGEGSEGASVQNSGSEAAGQAVQTGWKFQPDAAMGNSQDAAPELPHAGETVSWTASEYVAHHKTLMWFAGLGLAIALLALGVYFLTKETLSTVVIVIIGLSFGVLGARPPQVLQYTLDDQGLHVGGKLYPYNRIRSFSMLQEGAVRSILLMPLQRFMPPLSVYYDQADEERIISVIGSHIPHEEHDNDLVERLMSKIRF